MSPDPAAVVSVMDVGGTHVTAAHVDVGTRTLHRGRSFREPLDGDGSADAVVAALVRCAARLPEGGSGRWVLAVPGPFDYEHGIGRYEGVGKFDALRGVDLRAALTARLPGAADVAFCNDADAFVLGEWWAGAARGHRSVVGITLGTGVGSCFLRDGRVVREGPGIPSEGRAHLLRYAGQPLEETVSRRALRRAYGQAAGTLSPPDVREIALRAREGERLAADVLFRAFRALGLALGPALAAFDPSVLVVGGSIASSWDLVAEPLREGLADAVPERAGRTDLVRAQLPETAALLGAAYVATTRQAADLR
ncbi:ROK family protein [Streptacidiphilus jiangxiensis]|uniref:Glucokinase n=1 Tax=Streptacidiphilus jiangxiensis TaxID=235985 RepID=A0A1H7WDG2_STRJI|nr:ROK family protein [Streptacidiphilus jiangxiensis]SEM19551.1 glucokinase [Streptacidiphilus jiangxiensis]